MWFKYFRNLLPVVIALAGCTPDAAVWVTVHNPSSFSRENEMVEISMESLKALNLKENDSFVVLTSDNKQVPYQVTYDSLLIFPVSIASDATVQYKVCQGIPEKFDTISCGRQYPERLDDIAWENDKAAYRAYGPALQAKGERAYGYDVFTKSVSYPVVEERYRRELDAEAWAKIHALQKEGKREEADSLIRVISYHVDHGNGMDCYDVGPTLGGGTAALLTDSSIVYPYCYQDYEILDNGPLRFTVKLIYRPLIIENDSNIVETRVITLDKGSYLNRTHLFYSNLTVARSLATGIVIHPQNPNGYAIDSEKQYIAYADSTSNSAENGIIYLGAVFSLPLDEAKMQPLCKEERKVYQGALGHVLGISNYVPDTEFVYYWGSGWSKAGITSMEAWELYLKEYAERIVSPLEVSVE